MDGRRLTVPGPKRILALEGGGVRGVLTLAILQRLEEVLGQLTGRTDGSFRLAHYYDLIGGTSTGSIIATGLALGLPAAELLEMYRTLAVRVFKRPIWKVGLFGPKFSRPALETALGQVLGEQRFDSDSLLTGLAIVAKRADNGSVWVLHNNPRGRYYDPPADDPHAFPNRKIKLVSAVLASTAAPTYFQPESIEIAAGLRGAFVDGGASPHNNPSLMLLLMATLRGYNFNWQAGEDKLLLTSMGTGTYRKRYSEAEMRRWLPVQLAVNSLTSMIEDASRQTQALLQLMGTAPTARIIDSEMGDLRDDRLSARKLLHYLRYDGIIEIEWLARNVGLQVSAKDIKPAQEIDDPRAMDTLIEVGHAIARHQIRPEHFPEVFNKTIWSSPPA
jgi:predicted acylesterase/phospholipase RssA